ncbi:glycogen/starch synthase [Candidatus Azambacteria bacterium]|nr:glycogen/starch synthase [Candidatus Azambacteria bacterium]
MQKPDFIFEISWETVNKVGGINTVIVSKAREMVKNYGANYFLVGPYIKAQTVGQFEEIQPPEYFAGIFASLQKKGVKAYFGKWLIEGEPFAILLDFDALMPYTNSIKKELWDFFQVDSLGASIDFNEPVAWGFGVGKLLEELALAMPEKRIIGHFHEWLAGSGILYLKNKNAKIATVFTTHATTLGRSLAGGNVDFYSNPESINVEQEARTHYVQHKHKVEEMAAKNADIFTTVSQITAIEAEYFLGRKPDLVLPNGIDVEKLPTIEEITEHHSIQRNRIREFLIYYFFPYYTFDIKQTLFYFLGARYEFHNKGVDIFIEALARLNKKLKDERSKKTIVSFIWVPTAVKGINERLVKSREYFRDIMNSFEEEHDEMDNTILYSLLTKEDARVEDLFDETFLRNLRNQIKRLKSSVGDSPLLATHDVLDPNDKILRSLKEHNLLNKEEDRVKVVFYPIYSSGSDGVLDQEYYESIQGSHLGVFPSFYEPWGYTPLESAGLGVSAVTTDLSGFGRYFRDTVKDKEFPGVYVIDRLKRPDEDVTNDLLNIMYKYASSSRRDRVQNKISAYNLAAKADWSIFAKEYFKAHEQALIKRYK